MRSYKKLNEKEYSLLKTNCQTGSEDVAYHLTKGRSTLTPAPVREWPEILLDKVDTEGLSRSVRRAKRIGGMYSRDALSNQSSEASVEKAMRNFSVESRKQGWF